MLNMPFLNRGSPGRFEKAGSLAARAPVRFQSNAGNPMTGFANSLKGSLWPLNETARAVGGYGPTWRALRGERRDSVC